MDYFQTPPKPKTSKRFFLTPVLFVILFLFISALFVFTYQNFQRTSPPLSSWQSYTNKEYGFMVSYPSKITPKIIPTDTASFFVNFKNEIDQKATWFSVQVDKSTLEEAVNFIRSQTEGHLPVVLSKKSEITHAGFPGFRLEYTPDSSNVSQSLTYVFIKNNIYIYTISAPSKDVSQILSTFKFIDAKDQTKNWKTYTDTKNGFSLKYPSDFLKYQDPSVDFFVATSSPQGGNGPKFLQTNDLWLEVEILQGTNLKSTDEYLNTLGQKKFPDKKQQLPIIVDGVKGILVDYNTPISAGNVIQYTKVGVIVKNEKIFIFSLSSWDNDILKANKILFNQILLTFKFVDL